MLLCLLLLTGCNKGLPAGKGSVTGKVTLGGKEVGPDAFVAFFGADGKELVRAPTDGESHYNISEVPVGPVKIAVMRVRTADAAPVANMDPSMPGATSAAALPIPSKYSKLDNGLTYTVTQGKQRHDIELTP